MAFKSIISVFGYGYYWDAFNREVRVTIDLNRAQGGLGQHIRQL